jgi:CyaY protein
MTDLEYFEQAERALASVELGCDRVNEKTDTDLDSQRTGNMVTLTFSNRSQIIINLQKPLQEIWMAAKAGGFHYKCVDKTWRDTKSGNEFFADLSRYASEQSSELLVFTA